MMEVTELLLPRVVVFSDERYCQSPFDSNRQVSGTLQPRHIVSDDIYLIACVISRSRNTVNAAIGISSSLLLLNGPDRMNLLKGSMCNQFPLAIPDEFDREWTIQRRL